MPKIVRHTIIALVVCMNVYAIAQALNYENWPGVLLAAGSLVGLGVCIHLMNKLKEVQAAEEEQLLQ